MSFLAPGISTPGPYTECFVCGAWKKDHDPAGECPAFDDAEDLWDPDVEAKGDGDHD